MRLIDAVEAKKLFDDIPIFIGMTGKCVQDMLDKAPTVDAEPVRHGRWVQKEFWPGGGTWRCSECGCQVMFMEDTPAAQNMHYCHNCGAKMDEGVQ